MRSQWLLPLALAAGVLIMAGLWYTASRSSEAIPSQAEGVYIEGTSGAPSRINPLYAGFNGVDTDLSRLVFSGLTRLGLDGEALPDLAETWDVSHDGLTYTFHLRDGVSWHDGEAFNADDVLFTFDAIGDPDFRGDPALASLFQSVAVRKTDDLTIEVELPQPFAPFLAHASVGILPEHLLSGLNAEQLFNAPFNQRPTGTGPFQLVELTNQGAVLNSFETHYLGEAHIRRIELRFFADEPTLLRALKERDVQGAFFRSSLNTADRLYLESEKRYQVLKPTSTTYTILYLNDAKPFFQDRRIRQALAYAVDRDGLITTVLDGQGIRLDSPIAAGTWAYYPALDRYHFNPQQAGKLLDEAGWTLGVNGIRSKEGIEMRFDLYTNEERPRILVAEEIARSWAAIGVQATVRTEKASNLLRDRLVPRNYDAVIYGFDVGLDPDPYPTWHSTQSGPGGSNLSTFTHQQADFVLEQARQIDDPLQRKSLYREFQEIFAQEVPSLPLFHRAFTYALDARLKGVSVGVLFDSGARFALVHQWYFDEE